MPTVKAGNRICQPITQANCRRDSRTGSRSMVDPPVALGNKTDKRSASVRSRLHRCCHQGESSDPEQLSLARAAHDLDSLFSPVAWDRARHLGRIEANAHLSAFGAKRT